MTRLVLFVVGFPRVSFEEEMPIFLQRFLGSICCYRYYYNWNFESKSVLEYSDRDFKLTEISALFTNLLFDSFIFCIDPFLLLIIKN